MKMLLVTHSGNFHADEVVASSILLEIVENDNDVKLVRTNNLTSIDSYCDEYDRVIIYDIGGGEYDHHQKGGNGKRDNGIPYASAGLIWKSFGSDYVGSVCSRYDIILGINDAKEIADRIDRIFIQPIDAVDNGMSEPSKLPIFTFSSAISAFNTQPYMEVLQYARFDDAVDFSREILRNLVFKIATKIKNREVVKKIVENRLYRRILILDEFMDWQEQACQDDALWYCIFPSSRNEGRWNIQCVPPTPCSFSQRHPVPQEWWGGNEKTLPEITGISGFTFCHQNGFLMEAMTKDEAIEICLVAIASVD